MTEKPLVSIIVPTRNSSATIGQCLKSIRSQTYGNIEILVVDNFSSDNTRNISRSHGARVIVSKAKRSEARNIGFQDASGSLLFFVDSDMELTSAVISKCVETLAEGNDAAIVPEISIGQGFWAECKALERSCYSGDDLVEGIRFMTRSSFEEIGGYDEELEAGEDWDLCNRFKVRGYKIVRVSEAVKHNEGRLSILSSVSKKYYYSQTLGDYIKKYPSLSRRQLSPFKKAYLRNWRRFASNPLCAVGFGILKTCEYFGGFLGYFKIKKKKRELQEDSTYSNRKEDRKILPD